MITESVVEDAALAWLGELGPACRPAGTPASTIEPKEPQLADLIAGSLGRACLVGKADQWDYWKLVRHREMHVQRWPKRDRPGA